MRRSFALATSAVMIAGGLQIALSPVADAAPTCVYRPVLPARVVVNQSVVGMRIPLAISGPAACRDPLVSTQLVHGSDSYYLLWTDTSPDVESVYAYAVSPGTYRTTAEDCSAYDSNFNTLSCTVARASTVIKFGGQAGLSAKRSGKRSGKRVTLTAKTARYDAYGNKPTSTRVSIQRLSGGKWKTIKHATTRGAKGYSWTFTKRAKARYRVVAAENAAAFGATSRSVRK